MADSVSITELVKKIRLDVFYGEDLLDKKQVTVSDISRPGLELTNYFKFYPASEFSCLAKPKFRTQRIA